MEALARRSLLKGLFAAPAIVAAGSLMPLRGERLYVPASKIILESTPWGSDDRLTIQMITREAIRLWKNSNEFIQYIDRQYPTAFGMLPLGYKPPNPVMSTTEVAALGTAAVIAKNPIVSRRFWR